MMSHVAHPKVSCREKQSGDAPSSKQNKYTSGGGARVHCPSDDDISSALATTGPCKRRMNDSTLNGRRDVRCESRWDEHG